jgi:outer membrane murein-binding lipoprotein Lpp
MKKNVIVIILISIIVILLAVLGYGVYGGLKARAMINSLQSNINGLNADKNDLTNKLDILQGKYDLLEQDVAKIYKGCMKENACKGRFPSVSWYCNNVGDEVSDPSHICVCDSSCNLNATQIIR